MARRRSWMGRFLLLVAVLLLLLLGRGLGLLPTVGGAEPPPAAAPPAAPLGTAGVEPDPRGKTAADDRLASLASAVRAASGEGRLGAAFAALDALASRPGAAAVAADLGAMLRARLRAAVDELAGAVAAGEVLAARAQLAALLEQPAAEVAAALVALGVARGWPSFVATARQPGEVPAPLPLGQDRAVRTVAGGDLLRSRIVAQRGDGVTLRVVGPGGVTFPTVPLWSVAPEGATAAEAAEIGLAALAAGEVRLARLWCACGLARASPPPPRLLLLRQFLP